MLGYKGALTRNPLLFPLRRRGRSEPLIALIAQMGFDGLVVLGGVSAEGAVFELGCEGFERWARMAPPLPGDTPLASLAPLSPSERGRY